MRRSNFNVMTSLLKFVKPMWGWMSLAVTLGTIGHLMASFIVILGALCLLHVVWGAYDSIVYLGIAMFGCGILRGVFRYD